MMRVGVIRPSPHSRGQAQSRDMPSQGKHYGLTTVTDNPLSIVRANPLALSVLTP
jgi:hypothetical protein